MENQSTANSAIDATQSSYKVRLMISYGGKIQPRTRDHQLTYVGGDTKILAVDRSVKFADIVTKLISLCNAGELSFKYQLPGEDLDALVSVINDDDLEIMMTEYDRIRSLSSKPARLRLFVFSRNPPKPTSPTAQKTASPTAAAPNPDFLFGFDKECDYSTPKPEITPFASPTGADILEIGGNYSEQVVYRVPVTSGGYQCGAGPYGVRIYREQPVYNLVPGMFASPGRFGFGTDESMVLNRTEVDMPAIGGISSQYQMKG